MPFYQVCHFVYNVILSSEYEYVNSELILREVA